MLKVFNNNKIMSYDSLIKEFVDVVYWNIDHMFNYLSFDSVKIPTEIKFNDLNIPEYIVYGFFNLQNKLGSFNSNYCEFQYSEFNIQKYLELKYPIYNYFDSTSLDLSFLKDQDHRKLLRKLRYFYKLKNIVKDNNLNNYLFCIDDLEFEYLKIDIQQFLRIKYFVKNVHFNTNFLYNHVNIMTKVSYIDTFKDKNPLITLILKIIESVIKLPKTIIIGCQNIFRKETDTIRLNFFTVIPNLKKEIFSIEESHFKAFLKYQFNNEVNKFIYFYSPIFLSLKQFFINLIKGEWIQNFSNISLIHDEFIESIVNENIFFNIQSKGYLTILQLPIYLENKFFIGFLNSIFLSLPFSCNQLISFYTFLIYGPFLGFISTLGWITGQLSLFACVLFGFKSIIIQWFSLEPLNYFLGIYLIIIFLRESLQKLKKNQSHILKRGKRKKKKEKRKSIRKKLRKKLEKLRKRKLRKIKKLKKRKKRLKKLRKKRKKKRTKKLRKLRNKIKKRHIEKQIQRKQKKGERRSKWSKKSNRLKKSKKLEKLKLLKKNIEEKLKTTPKNLSRDFKKLKKSLKKVEEKIKKLEKTKKLKKHKESRKEIGERIEKLQTSSIQKKKIKKSKNFRRSLKKKRKRFFQIITLTKNIINFKIKPVKSRTNKIFQVLKIKKRLTSKLKKNYRKTKKKIKKGIKIKYKKIRRKFKETKIFQISLKLKKKIKKSIKVIKKKQQNINRKKIQLLRKNKRDKLRNNLPSTINSRRKYLRRKKSIRMMSKSLSLISTTEPEIKEFLNLKRRIKPGKIFALHFLLAWTENGYLFSYLNSLNLGTSSTILDLSFVSTLAEYIIIHLSYLIGLLFGCLFFSYIYNKAFLKLYFKMFKIKYLDKDIAKKFKKEKRRRQLQTTLLKTKKEIEKRKTKQAEKDEQLKIISSPINKKRSLSLKRPQKLKGKIKTKTLRIKKQKTLIPENTIFPLYFEQIADKKEVSNNSQNGRYLENLSKKYKNLKKTLNEIFEKFHYNNTLRKFYRGFIGYTDTLSSLNSIYFSKRFKYSKITSEETIKEYIQESISETFKKLFLNEYQLIKNTFKKEESRPKDKKKFEKFTKTITLFFISVKILFKSSVFLIKFFFKQILRKSLLLLFSLPFKIFTRSFVKSKHLMSNFIIMTKNVLSFFTNLKLLFIDILKIGKKKDEYFLIDILMKYVDRTTISLKNDISISNPNLLDFNLNKKTPRFIGRKLIIRRITTTLFTIILGILMSSFSYYDVGYIFTRPLGFIPQDQRISKVIMNSNSDDVCNIGLSSERDLYQYLDNNFLYSDIMSIDAKEYKNGLTFEQVNYQAEYSWASRSDQIKQSAMKFFEPEIRKQPKFKYFYCSTEKDIQIKEKEYLEIEEDLKTKDYFVKEREVDSILIDIYNSYESYYDEEIFEEPNHYKEKIDSNFKIEFLPIDLDSEEFQWDENDYLVEGEIGEEVKQTYYKNPLYKLLLDGEIDAFISRQPNDYILSEFEENELFLRRKAISNYYESNFYYSKINHFENFRNIFFDTKSSLNTSYNQQFKGTLNIIQRLFPVSLDNHNVRSVLKYDFPLTKKAHKDLFSHEELLNNGKQLPLNYKSLLSTSSSPLFIKWNNHLNQLVMTNNLILKEIDNLDVYETFSPYQLNYSFNSLNILNLQKFSGLIRNSYSIIQCPSLRLLGSSPDMMTEAGYFLNKFDLPIDFSIDYIKKIGTQSNPDLKLLNSWLNRFNWYSFRYTQPFEYFKNTDEISKLPESLNNIFQEFVNRIDITAQEDLYRYRRGINHFNKLNTFSKNDLIKDKVLSGQNLEDLKILKNLYDIDQINLILFLGDIFE